MVLMLGLTGCASTNTTPPGDKPDIVQQDIAYTVKSGDLLGTIAERFTGRHEDWRVIAAHNGISDPRTLAIGATLMIPGSLVQTTESVTAQLEQEASIGEMSTRQNNLRSRISIPTGSSVSVARGRAAAGDEIAPIELSAVDTNRSFDLEPLDEPVTSDAAASLDESESPTLVVSGTYYPKGIYEEPANYARLIQRAAPGTIFPIESKVNTWYRIITDEGVGYIRQTDSVIVD